MIAGWMLYMVLVSALMLGAGLLLEEAARRIGWPRRWIWAAVLAGSGLVPLMGGPAGDPPAAPPDDTSEIGRIAVMEPVMALAGPQADWREALPALDPLLLAIWAGASALLLLIGVVSALRLRRDMSSWTDAGLGKPRVLVSEDTGPAVVGLFPGAIVLPRWAVGADPAVRRLMLAHEAEHLRARDPALLLAGRGLLLLTPWNLPLWWQLRRLRLAVEIDCDARVLRRGSDLRSYATLLMEVGRRRSGLERALVSFAEPASFLERRIRIMTMNRGRNGWGFAFVLAAASLALVVGACGLEQPTGQTGPDAATVRGGAEPSEAYPVAEEAEDQTVSQEPEPGSGAAPDAPESEPEAQASRRNDDAPARSLPGAPSRGGVMVPSESEPEFTPREVEPELRNRAEFSQSLERAYPSLLRDAGIGGRVMLWVRIDETGSVTSVRVYESSGFQQLDEAAMQVMRNASFSPAENEGRNVAVWVAMPVTWQTASTADVQPAPIRARRAPAALPGGPARESEGGLAARPAFTPREQEPELRSAAEFRRRMAEAYPPLLRDANIGGRVVLWVYVDENGKVGNTRVYESSGYRELDEAAEALVRAAEFTPARNRGEVVPAWVALPVTFGVTR